MSIWEEIEQRKKEYAEYIASLPQEACPECGQVSGRRVVTLRQKWGSAKMNEWVLCGHRSGVHDIRDGTQKGSVYKDSDGNPFYVPSEHGK